MIKHFTLSALGCLLVAGMATAAPTSITNGRHLNRGEAVKTITMNGVEYQRFIGNTKVKAPARAAASTPLTNAPGTANYYNKNVLALYEGYQIEYGPFFGEVKWDNNDVYFFNPFEYDFNTWIKGTLNTAGTEVNVALPQTIYSDEEGWSINICALQLQLYKENQEAFDPIEDEDYDGALYFNYLIDENITSYNYLVSENGDLQYQTISTEFDELTGLPIQMLGLIYTDTDEWVGDGYLTESFYPAQEATVLPSDAISVEMSYIDADKLTGYPVTVAYQDGNVYFKGLSQEYPELVVYGILQNADLTEAERPGDLKLIYIPQNQFVGAMPEVDFIYTKAVYPNVSADPEKPETGALNLFAPDAMGYYLLINPETATIAPAQNNISLVLNLGELVYEPICSLNSFEIVPLMNYAGTPQNARNLEYFTDLAIMEGYNEFRFTIPTISNEGNLLNAEELYYIVYVNGEAITFEEKEGTNLNDETVTMYAGVNEPTTMMPLSFDNGEDIYKFNETNVMIGLYDNNINSVGVQVLYTYYGEELSEIVTLDVVNGQLTSSPAQSGVETVNAADIVSSEYFNLNGQRVANPENGIYVKRSVLSDGTVVVKKVNRR